MGESEGRENEARGPETGAVPEGARASEGSAADPAQRDELQTFRGRGLATGTLDLAAANDEPEQLVRYLIIAAQEWIGFSEDSAKWKIILGHAAKASEELEKLNEPRRRG